MTMTDNMTAKLKSLVALALEIEEDQVSDDLCAINCPEWDSARHIMIIMAIEEEFDISFDVDDFAQMPNFAALVTLVEQKTTG